MSSSGDVTLGSRALYFYGYQGRVVVDVRVPSARPDNARALIDRYVEVAGQRFRIVTTARQIAGPDAGRPADRPRTRRTRNLFGRVVNAGRICICPSH